MLSIGFQKMGILAATTFNHKQIQRHRSYFRWSKPNVELQPDLFFLRGVVMTSVLFWSCSTTSRCLHLVIQHLTQTMASYIYNALLPFRFGISRPIYNGIAVELGLRYLLSWGYGWYLLNFCYLTGTNIQLHLTRAPLVVVIPATGNAGWSGCSPDL